MPRRLKHVRKKGLPPGTLVHTGQKRTEKITLTLVHYDESKYEQKTIHQLSEITPYLSKKGITWLNVAGVHDVDFLQNLGNQFQIHPLVLEDIVNTDQRAKSEAYDNYQYVVVRKLNFSSKTDELESEQVSFILFKNVLLTFQEDTHPIFTSLYDRLKVDGSRIRKMGTDYLMYALIDNIVDEYFGVLDQFGDKLEDLEDYIMDDADKDTMKKIQHVRRELIYFRKSVWPLRDMLNSLYRLDTPLIDVSMRIYLRDVYDHSIHVIDTVENYRDMIMSLTDTYMSSVSNRMNEVMKVLTIIATIFIPLTFIVGLYGMNFDPSVSPYNMPELKTYYGYPAVWVVMIIISIIMVLYFKRKKWL
ncbi:MAG TPA: magnesium/cobalt transporter CorA [Balneolales bacterium]|nr:magnesium/cobalt transporter CorA [Balneolales bacterium]